MVSIRWRGPCRKKYLKCSPTPWRCRSSVCYSLFPRWLFLVSTWVPSRFHLSPSAAANKTTPAAGGPRFSPPASCSSSCSGWPAPSAFPARPLPHQSSGTDRCSLYSVVWMPKCSGWCPPGPQVKTSSMKINWTINCLVLAWCCFCSSCQTSSVVWPWLGWYSYVSFYYENYAFIID